MVWVLLALGGAVCTSMTTILAKIGIKDVNSNFATAYRTLIVIVCALVMCLATGDISQFGALSGKNWLFLVLSGLATGISWLFYFGALKEGDVNKVAPIDKSSFVLSAILFLIFFFDDTTKGGDTLTICMLCLTMVLMLAGTFLMLPKFSISKRKIARAISKLARKFAKLRCNPTCRRSKRPKRYGKRHRCRSFASRRKKSKNG